jgi:hypothetical protein
MKIRNIPGIAALVILPGLAGFGAAAASAGTAFVAVDHNGAFATQAAPVSGEVVAYRGVAHTVVDASTNVVTGITTFHLTNPFAASGNITLIPVS